MRTITEIILHCTATYPNQSVTLADVIRWHRARGWKTIGYHFLILKDGKVEKGRDLTEIGAHCLHHNTNSIGVCYVGGLSGDGSPADTRTAAQKEAMAHLLAHLRQQFPSASIHGHNEFAQKACPCFDVPTWLKEAGL